jgi:hypothetical protein
MLHAVEKKRATAFLARVESMEPMRHPLEDMITSTVFGPLELMPENDAGRGLARILGIGLRSIDSIKFWPRRNLNGESIEPDLVVDCQTDTSQSLELRIEVKWNSPFDPDQIEKQSRLSPPPNHQVRSIAVVRDLSSARAEWKKSKHSSSCKLLIRSWREIADNAKADTTAPRWLRRWIDLVRTFLREQHEIPFSGFASLQEFLPECSASMANLPRSGPIFFKS